MRSEILEINELNEEQCSVVYKVLNKRKNVIYKKNSKKLQSCFTEYIGLLEEKIQRINNKNNNHLLKKRILVYVITILFSLSLIYIILSNFMNAFSYIISLLIIIISFLCANFFNYKTNILLDYEERELNNEILKSKELKKNCTLYKKSL